MKNNFWKASITSAALLISGASQAALVTLTYSGTNTDDTDMQTIFTVDSDELLRVESATGRQSRDIQLLTAEYTTGGITTAFDTENPFLGNASASTRFQIDSSAFFQGSSSPSGENGLIFTFDESTNEVSYQGEYQDQSTFEFLNFIYTGTDYNVDLTSIISNSFTYQGNINIDGFFTDFTVTNLHVEVSGVSAVPVPAAVWLFGSGLIGLAGIARRRV